jgi:hypothetical protein
VIFITDGGIHCAIIVGTAHPSWRFFLMPDRNMDLLRQILLEVEMQAFQRGYYELSIEGYTEEQISYHVQLARDAGLIEAIDLSDMDGTCWRPTRLTFQGHEFLEAARNPSFWRQAKELVLQKTGTLTIEGLKIALAELIRTVMR